MSSPVVRNVYPISAAFFFIFFGFGTAQQYLVILFTAQGRGHLALVSLFLLYGAFLLSGIVISKIIPFFGGLKRSLLIGTLTYALFVASVALNNTPLLFIASIIVGVGASLLWVASGQIIVDSSDGTTTGRNLSLQQIGQFSGNILGIWAGGYLVHTLALEPMYVLLASTIMIGFICLLWIKPVKEEAKERPFTPSYLLKPHMLVLLPLVFSSSFLLAQTFTAMNLIIVTFLGVASIPLIISILKVSNIIGSFSNGSLSGKYPKAPLLIFLIVVALLGVGFFTLTHTLVPLIVGAILIGFSAASIYPVTLSWLKETLPAEDYLYALGGFHVYTNIGVLSAVSANLWLPAGTSFIPGAIALVLAIAGILLYRRLYLSYGT